MEQKEINRILGQTVLFHDLGESRLREALLIMRGRIRHYEGRAVLHVSGEPLSFFGLVLGGSVQVTMNDLDGRDVLMASVRSGETFGEAICALRRPDPPINIYAEKETDVLWLSAGFLHEPGRGPQEELRSMLVCRLAEMMAGRTLRMNRRIQVLSKHTLREKLLTFFAECREEYGGPSFTIPMDRATMAAYLGTDRSALSRELSRMRREGLVLYRKNEFTLQMQPTKPS